MARQPKRYRVTGEDGNGDIHTFETDAAGRAVAMQTQFAEDLRDVTCDVTRDLEGLPVQLGGVSVS